MKKNNFAPPGMDGCGLSLVAARRTQLTASLLAAQVNITFEPLEVSVTAPIPEYGLKPGDMVFGYMNVGEGY